MHQAMAGISVHQASIMAQCCATESIMLSMLQCCASGIIIAQNGSMLCRYQFIARFCASGITVQHKPVHHESIRLDVVHP